MKKNLTVRSLSNPHSMNFFLDLVKIRKELARLDDFVSKGLRIKGARLREVHIMGYASPEGEFSYNKHLAERRTHTLSYYVLSKYPQLEKASIYENRRGG